MENNISINRYFEEKLQPLKYDSITKSYIIGIFSKHVNPKFDLSKDSVTLRFLAAKKDNDFEMFQTVADWIFYSSVLFPKSLNAASSEYYSTVGSLSYYNCYKIVKQWRVYENLADEFIPLTKQCSELIKLELDAH